VRAARPALASVLEHAIPLEVDASRVVVGYEPSAAFLAARASEPESLETLTREVRAHFGAPTQVALDLSAKPSTQARTVASVDAERRSAELAKARARVEEHPVVREAIRLFGAQVRDVKLPNGEA
jgi:DNA polymerase-3 subunit gamma/tau